jgi:hypothetical protein
VTPDVVAGPCVEGHPAEIETKVRALLSHNRPDFSAPDLSPSLP